MSKIRILPENLANQIAAGEVVERPASVVKEFVENAIDAGAGKISVQIEGAGSRLIRVIDNGHGMEEDDVLLCLERHATSKLHAVQDLGEISTLGFRGEAIPSIASVARLTIVSKTKKAALGSKCEIRFGKIIKVHEMGCAAGTIMEVKDLFANLPVRRKFLKSKKTEISHIDDVIKNYALVNPEIGFNYQLEGRTVLDLSAGATFEERAQTIVCRGSGDALLRLTGAGGKNNEIVLNGYLAAPDVTGGSGLHLFVNGRVVKDRGITHAVSEGLRGFLLKGRRPMGVIFLSLPPAMVDVNVHPTKQEVRFQKAGQVYDIVVRAVSSGMDLYQDIRRKEVFGGQKNSPPPQSEIDRSEKDSSLLEIAIGPAETVYEEIPPEPVLSGEVERQPIIETPAIDEPEIIAPVVNSPKVSSSEPKEKQPVDVAPAGQVESKIVEDNLLVEKVNFPHYLGHVFDTYLLCEVGDAFVVVDQHAGQERLIYEDLRQHYAKKAIPRQALLFPEILELTVEEREAVEQYSAEIIRLGLEIKEFGGESFVVTAVPASLGHLPPGEVFRGIVSSFISGDEGVGRAIRLDSVLAGMACKASVKAGNRLLPQEAEALLNQMWQAGVFSHCPHGRPVARVFSKDEVKKWFLRT